MPDEKLLPGYLVSERYEVDELVASSDMSDVYFVRDSRLRGKEHVLKVMRTNNLSGSDLHEAKQYFEREAELLSQLKHPNIITILDYFVDNNLHCIVMDKIKGSDMEKYVNQHHPVSEKGVRDYSLQILDVMDYLHAQSKPVIFRDLKPSNCMRSDDGKITLIDFGIARFYVIGNKNTCIGTESYAAPEQHLGLANTLSDIYGAGATMFYFLTAKNPHVTLDCPEISSSLRALRSDTSASLVDIVQKAMESNQKDRYQSANEMMSALNSLNSHTPKLLNLPAPKLLNLPAYNPSAGGNNRPVSNMPASAYLGAHTTVTPEMYENEAKEMKMNVLEIEDKRAREMVDEIRMQQEANPEKNAGLEDKVSDSRQLIKKFKELAKEKRLSTLTKINGHLEEKLGGHYAMYNSFLESTEFDMDPFFKNFVMPAFFSSAGGGLILLVVCGSLNLPVGAILSIGLAIVGALGSGTSMDYVNDKLDRKLPFFISPKNINKTYSKVAELKELTDQLLSRAQDVYDAYKHEIDEIPLLSFDKEERLHDIKTRISIPTLEHNLSILNEEVGILQELMKAYDSPPHSKTKGIFSSTPNNGEIILK